MQMQEAVGTASCTSFMPKDFLLVIDTAFFSVYFVR